jgi:hypothetical protein
MDAVGNLSSTAFFFLSRPPILENLSALFGVFDFKIDKKGG